MASTSSTTFCNRRIWAAAALAALAAVLLAAQLVPPAPLPPPPPPPPLEVQQPTPLMRAAARGDAAQTAALLRQALAQPRLRAQIAARDAMDRTALHYALEGAHAQALALAGAAPAEARRVLEGHAAVLDALLELPTEVLDAGYGCPVYYGVHLRDLPALRRLLRRNADGTRRTFGCLLQTDAHGAIALHNAAASKSAGMARMLRRLAQARTDNAAVADYLGLDAAFVAANVVRPEQAQEILAHTVLEQAMTAEDVALIADAMLALSLNSVAEYRGANDALPTPKSVLDWPNAQGDSALIVAARTGKRLEVLGVLVTRGADVNWRNRWGHTALHVAAAAGFVDHVAELLRHGADCALRDHRGRSALDIAQLLKHSKVVEHLQQTPGCRSSDESKVVAPRTRPTDAECDIDIVDGNQLTPQQFFEDYVLLQRPLLIRQGSSRRITWEALVKTHGELQVAVGAMPYASLYGAAPPRRQTIRDFVATSITAAPPTAEPQQSPLYVFDGQVMGNHPELEATLPPPREYIGDNLVLKQLMLGGPGSGAAPHFHGHAINILARGRKRWMFFAQPEAFFWFGTAQAWWSEWQALQGGNRAAVHSPMGRSCVQRAGDVVYVPAGWGHAVINEEAVIAAAYEFVP